MGASTSIDPSSSMYLSSINSHENDQQQQLDRSMMRSIDPNRIEGNSSSASSASASSQSYIRRSGAQLPASMRDQTRTLTNESGEVDESETTSTHNNNNQRHQWRRQYDFVHQRNVYVQHQTQRISHAPDEAELEESHCNSPMSSTSPFFFVDLPTSMHSSGMQHELAGLLRPPTFAHSLRTYREGQESDEKKQNGEVASSVASDNSSPIFLRWLDSTLGRHMRRHFDVTELALSRFLSPDAIKSEDDLIRVRKDWINVTSQSIAQGVVDRRSFTSVGDTKVITFVTTRLTELLANKKAKQLLQTPLVSSLFQLFESLPNGSLGPCLGHLDESSIMQQFWNELEAASQLLTLQQVDMEWLVKLSLTALLKSARATTFLRVIHIWSNARMTYGSMRLQGLTAVLEKFSNDVMLAMWKQIEEATSTGSTPNTHHHITFTKFRSTVQSSIELKLPSMSEQGDSTMTLQSCSSFVLSHIGLLAESITWFHKWSHLKTSASTAVSSESSSAAAASQQNKKPSSLILPLVLDLNRTYFLSLVQSYHDALQAKQNDRINIILNQSDSTDVNMKKEGSTPSSSSLSIFSTSPSPSSNFALVEASLSQLFSPSSLASVDHLKSVKLLLKLLANILSQPLSEKFRRIKSSHPSFVQLIGSKQERIQVLWCIGFEKENRGGEVMDGNGTTVAASASQVPSSSSSSSSLQVTPNSPEMVCLPVTPNTHQSDSSSGDRSSSIGSYSPLPSFPSLGSPLLPQTSFFSSSQALLTQEAESSPLVDEFMFLPSSSLNRPLVQHMYDAMHRTLMRIQQMSQMAKASSVDCASITFYADGDAHESSSSSPHHLPTFPFLPHLVSPSHPQSSQYDHLHLLSLLNLFLYTADTWNVDAKCFSTISSRSSRSSESATLKNGEPVWKVLVEHLLHALNDGRNDMNAPANADGTTASALRIDHSSSILHEQKELDEVRAERDRVISVLLLAFPRVPTPLQLTIVQASVKDDALRCALMPLIQERGLHLLPLHSPPPFASVWERLRHVRPSQNSHHHSSAASAAESSSMARLLAEDRELVHLLIAQMSQANLNLPVDGDDSLPSNVYQSWSPAMKKIMEYLAKTQSMSSRQALTTAYVAASIIPAAEAGGDARTSGAIASPIGSPSLASVLSPTIESSSVTSPVGSTAIAVTGVSSSSTSTTATRHIDLPLLSLGPRLVSEDASTHAKEFQRGALMSPTRNSSDGASSSAAAAIPSLSLNVPSGSATRTTSSGSSPQLLSCPSGPSPNFSPMQSPASSPGSPAPLMMSWSAVQSGGSSSATRVNSIESQIDLQQYTRLLDSLFVGLLTPHSCSAMSCLSSTSSTCVRSQYSSLLTTLFDSWSSLCLTPITAYDVYYAPKLVELAVKSFVKHMLKEVEQAKERWNERTDVEMSDDTNSDITSWQSYLHHHSPLCAFFAPFLLSFNALLNVLPPQSLSSSTIIDPPFLAQLYALYTSIGGFDACETDEKMLQEDGGKLLMQYISKSASPASNNLSYSDYFKLTLPSDPVIDYLRAPPSNESGESSLLLALKSSPHLAKVSSLVEKANKLQELTERSSVLSDAVIRNLPLQLRELIERDVFSIEPSSSSPTSSNRIQVYPNLSNNRLQHSSLLQCPMSGYVAKDALSLYHHRMQTDTSNVAATSSSSIWSNSNASWFVRRHALMYLMGAVSRHLATSSPSPAGSGESIDTKDITSTVQQSAPKTIQEWLRSDVMKGGFEQAYIGSSQSNSANSLPFSYPSSGSNHHLILHPILQSNDTSLQQASSADLFPFFRTNTQLDSTVPSKVTSPASLHVRRLSLPGMGTGGGGGGEDKSSSGLAEERMTSFESPSATRMPSQIGIGAGGGGIMHQLRQQNYLHSQHHINTRLDAYDDTNMSAKELGSTPVMKEEVDEKEKDLTMKELPSVTTAATSIMAPIQIQVNQVQTVDERLHHSGTSTPSKTSGVRQRRASLDALRKTLTIATPLHPSSVSTPNLDMTNSMQSSASHSPIGSKGVGVGNGSVGANTSGGGSLLATTHTTPLPLIGNFTSFPPSPSHELYPHASFLTHLIFGEGEASMLDESIMSLPQMRMHLTQRKMVPESCRRASRAILACLLKHTGKVELAVEYTKQQSEAVLQQQQLMMMRSELSSTQATSTTSAALKSKIPPSLIKLWKLSSELLPEMITLHQNGRVNYCATDGCNQTVVEVAAPTTGSSSSTSTGTFYRCGHGHIMPDCDSRETVKYDTLALRVMQSCEFLLQLRPAYQALQQADVANDPARVSEKLRAARKRKLLRAKPIDIPYSPHVPLTTPPMTPGTAIEEAQQRAQQQQLQPNIKRSHSNLSSWSPSPRTPVISNTTASGGTPTTYLSFPTLTPNRSRVPSDSSYSTPPEPTAAHDSKLRARVRRELSQHRWQELRTELLASRMPSLLHANRRLPLESLLMAFCRDVSIDTAHRARLLYEQLRDRARMAEYRTRGLESLTYLIRHAPTSEYKAMAIVQWNVMIDRWSNGGGGKTANGRSTSKSVEILARTLSGGASLSNSDLILLSSSSSHTYCLLPYRYDYLLHGVGQSLASQVQDAFYSGLIATLAVVKKCCEQINVEYVEAANMNVHQVISPMHHNHFYDALDRVVEMVKMTQSSLQSVTYPSSTACLTSLLLALQTWCFSLHLSNMKSDDAFMQSAQFLQLVQHLCQRFGEIGDGNKSHDAHEVTIQLCRAIGRSARRLFRMCALASLTQHRTSISDEDGDIDEEELAQAMLQQQEFTADGTTNESTKPSIWTTMVGGGVRADTFEWSMLHLLFHRLEVFTHERLRSSLFDGDFNTPTPTASATHAFFHPQDEIDCFETLSLLLLACSTNIHIKLSLSHHIEEEDGTGGMHQQQGPPSLPSNLPLADASQSSLSTRCFHLLAHLLHPHTFHHLSLRCQRRIVGLCHQLLPLVTPHVIELLWNREIEEQQREEKERRENSPDPVGVDAANPVSPPSPVSTSLITYLLHLIGYYSFGNLLESRNNSANTSTSSPTPHHLRSSHSQHLLSEFVSLVRHLQREATWSEAVANALSDALNHLSYSQLDLSNSEALSRFYSANGSLLIYGGFVEPLRIGAKVRIHRIGASGEKLSQRDEALDTDAASGGASSGDAIQHGFIIDLCSPNAIVVRESDNSSHRCLVPLGALEAIPAYPCTTPLYLHGSKGMRNLRRIIRYINATFGQTTADQKDPNAMFSLFPQPNLGASSSSAQSNQQQAPSTIVSYVHSLQQLHAMRALLHCMSLVLTRPDLIDQQVSGGKSPPSESDKTIHSLNSIDRLVQSILKHSREDDSDNTSTASSPSGLPLLSNLLSLCQQVLPVSRGVGKLDELQEKLSNFQEHIEDVTNESTILPTTMTTAPVHPDLFRSARALFPSDPLLSLAWCHSKQAGHQRFVDAKAKQMDAPLTEQIRSLIQEMGLDETLCKRALLLHNGDTVQSLHWLLEHGVREMTSIRKGELNDVWGLEGVDFYQEKGHWKPEVVVSAGSDEESIDSEAHTKHKASSLHPRHDQSPGESSLSTKHLAHSMPPMDSYRRLTLYTAMAMQDEAKRRVHVMDEMSGGSNGTSTASSKSHTSLGWSLTAHDIRAGQQLRVSSAWLSSKSHSNKSTGKQEDEDSSEEYRWYFLTEDNHWAPLDEKDIVKLNQSYNSGSSFCSIGVEEKTPSLIRFDKMCMYNEMTGHGRPLRRKRIAKEKNGLGVSEKKEEKQKEVVEPTAATSSSASTTVATSATSSAPPTTSFYLYDSFSSSHRLLVSQLLVMGFPREWCCLALTSTGYNMERAVNWLLNETNTKKCEVHEESVKKKTKEMEEVKKKEAAKRVEEEKLMQQQEPHKMPDTAPPILPPASPFISPNRINSSLPPQSVSFDRISSFSGCVGQVIAMAYPHGTAISSDTIPNVLLELIDSESSSLHLVWVPLTSLEWPSTKLLRVMPEYADLHSLQFIDPASQQQQPTVIVHRVTHAMQMSVAQRAQADSQLPPSYLHFGLDLVTSNFMVLGRRIALICLYLLSLPRPSIPASVASGQVSSSAGVAGAATGVAGQTSLSLVHPYASSTSLASRAAFSAHTSFGLIANLSATSFLRLVKLAAIDTAPLTLLIHDGGIARGQKQSQVMDSSAEGANKPSTPGLIPRCYWDVATQSLSSSSVLSSSSTKTTTTNQSKSSSVTSFSPPTSLDVWSVLSCVLHNPSPLFSSPSRDHLFGLLLEDCKRSLSSSSYFVRDIDTEHPYQSGITEIQQEIHIPRASSLLVTFDRRCNLNQAHAILAFYYDKECTQEIAIFSGSADEFSHVIIPYERFYYTFHSGGVRSKPYEFGFRFRVRPLGFNAKNEVQVMQNVSPTLATAMNMGVVAPQHAQVLNVAVGVPNVTQVMQGGVVQKEKCVPCNFTLGWPLLLLLTDSPLLIDTLLSHPHSIELIQAMLKYLTVCRSPCKVLVTRSLTSLCIRVKSALPTSMFEILVRVMEQLYESNTASGWGSSPFLMALVDLIRHRPHTFKLTDSDVWSIDAIDNRPQNWFFLTLVRSECLARSLLSSHRVPHIRVFERAYQELSDIEILRWCLKQPELCLKLHKQQRGWNQSRREWMVSINSFKNMTEASEVLIRLKDSLLPECYRSQAWSHGTAAKEWEATTRQSRTIGDISRAYMILESSLKWGDTFSETDRAFGETWSSRRVDWIAAMKGLASSDNKPVEKSASVQEAYEYKWTRSMDESLIRHWDEFTSKTSRRLMSLTFRDIEPLTEAELNACTLDLGLNTSLRQHTLNALRQVPLAHLRARFALLKMLSTDFMRVLPVVDLTFHSQQQSSSNSSAKWSLGSVVKATAKSLIFQQSKMYLWRSMLGRLYSEERPQFVILNRHESSKIRHSTSSRLYHSLFYQLYSSVGLVSDPSSLRRRGQAWQVKFVGEGGHDVGGMYNESLVELTNELQDQQPPVVREVGGAGGGDQTTVMEVREKSSSTQQPLMPLFRLCPNGMHAVGENRNKYLPNPSASSSLHLGLFEFIGRCMGICCLDNNRSLPLNLPSLVWKTIVGETLTLSDLKGIDYHTWHLIHMLKATKQQSGSSTSSATATIASPQGADTATGGDVNELTFPYLFPDLNFSVEIEVESSSGETSTSSSSSSSSTQKQIIDLIPHGRNIPVTYATSHDYASRLERFYLTRYNRQLRRICKGMASIVPFELLNVFTPLQLELLVSGTPQIDIDLLRDKTEYRGSLTSSDVHVVMFWEVLQEMTQEQRKNFLQFVWGRNRLPSNALGFGKDLFKLSDHALALQTHSHDTYLPISHTCFFALELPRYSTKAIMMSKLLYAISNCQSIDGDATHEGRANMMMAWEEDDDE